MTPLDLIRILALVFYMGSADGRVGLDAPPAQATEIWITHSDTHAPVWIGPDGITYAEEATR